MLGGAGVVGIKSRALATFSVLGVRILIIFGFTFSSVEEITPTAGEVRWFEKARQLRLPRLCFSLSPRDLFKCLSQLIPESQAVLGPPADFFI